MPSKLLLDDMMDVSQAAEAIGVCEESIRRSCRLGDLKHTKIGRQYLIHKKDLEHYNKNKNPIGWNGQKRNRKK